MGRTRDERLLRPKAGSKIAEARDYGIDLTQIVGNLRLRPEKRIEKLQKAMISFDERQRSARRVITT